MRSWPRSDTVVQHPLPHISGVRSLGRPLSSSDTPSGCFIRKSLCTLTPTPSPSPCLILLAREEALTQHRTAPNLQASSSLRVLCPLEIGPETEELSGDHQPWSLRSFVTAPSGAPEPVRWRGHLRAVSLQSLELGPGGWAQISARISNRKSLSLSSRPHRTMRLDERGVMCNC